jgi:hypothetical protein
MLTQADARPEYNAGAPVGAASAEVLEMAANAPHLDFTPTLTRLWLEEIVQAAQRSYPTSGHADLLAAYWRNNNV